MPADRTPAVLGPAAHEPYRPADRAGVRGAAGSTSPPKPYVRTRLRGARRFAGQPVIMAITFVLVGYLVLGPLGVSAISTFRGRGVLPLDPLAFGGLTLGNYREVFLSPDTYQLLWNTMAFTFGSLAVGGTLAIVLSWIIERTDIRWRNLQFALVVAPMAMPGMLSAIAWIFLLDPNAGLVNQGLRLFWPGDATSGPINIYSLAGMIFIEGIRMVPTIFLMTSAAFRSMDPALEEASRVSGASGWQTARGITVPLMFPAILAALLYYMIVVIEAFEVPGVIGMSAGRHVFSTAIYRAVYPVGGGISDYGLASTLGLILVAIAIVAIGFYQRATRHASSFVTITGKGYRPRRVPLGRWHLLTWVLGLSYFLVALAMPLGILIWRSTQPYHVPISLSALSNMSFRAYTQIATFPNILTSFRNTLILAIVTATATMALGFLVGWFSARVRTRLSRLLDLLTFVPHAIASIVIALGVLLIYLSFPNPVYGTVYIIAIAGTTRYISYATRLMNAGILQVDPSLEEASLVCRTGWVTTYRKVLMPLVFPVLLNGWIWVAVHAARELSAALMLYTPNSVVISTQIWVLWEAGSAGVAAAMGVVLIVSLILMTWLSRVVFIRAAKL